MSDAISEEKIGINHNYQNIDNIPLENIQNMRSPSEMGIICIDITNKCDLACSNCTRLLANQDYFWDMTIENFRTAVKTLKDFQGVVVIIGGNPCMHPKFDEITKIFAELRPNKQKRGLWTNNFFKHEKISTELYGVFNLNTHGDSRSTKSLKNFELKGGYHPDHSHHSPILTAIKDLWITLRAPNCRTSFIYVRDELDGKLATSVDSIEVTFPVLTNNYGTYEILDFNINDWGFAESYYMDERSYGDNAPFTTHPNIGDKINVGEALASCPLFSNFTNNEKLFIDKENIFSTKDLIEGYLGPLVGVLSAMTWIEENKKNYKWIATFPCDTPFFDENLIDKIKNCSKNSDKKLFFLKSGGRRHNIFGLWSLELKDTLLEDINNGHRKVEEWANKVGSEIIEIDDKSEYNFLNINTKEDLEKAKNKIK